jgi:hypothetical protein
MRPLEVGYDYQIWVSFVDRFALPIDGKIVEIMTRWSHVTVISECRDYLPALRAGGGQHLLETMQMQGYTNT